MSDSAPPSASPGDLPPDLYRVALAMGLLWASRPRTASYNLLRLLGLRRADGWAFTSADVKQAQDGLRERGLLVESALREGTARLVDGLRVPLYRTLLEERGGPALRGALYELESYHPERRSYTYYWPIYDAAATIGLVRLALFSGTPAAELKAMADAIARAGSWEAILREAAFAGFDGPSFERIEPSWRDALLYQAVSEMPLYWQPELLPPCDWALSRVMPEPATFSTAVRLALAELLLLRGEAEGVRALLEGVDSGAADALRAGLLVQAGHWAEGQAAFEAALKRQGDEVGARKRILPGTLVWLYPLALLAQQTPKHLEAARKFCLWEAGKRQPSPREGWGRWVHAVAMRLGDTAFVEGAFSFDLGLGVSPNLDHLWGLLLAAWLGRDRVVGAAPKRFLAELSAYEGALRGQLEACKLPWLAEQVEGAAAVLKGEVPGGTFFVAGPGEQWREVLAALEALGVQPETAEAAPATRIIWTLSLGPNGQLEEIQPLEQKRGVRGGTKPRTMSLARIAGSGDLPPWDAEVARALRPDRSYTNRFGIDRAAAIGALAGHPAVALADAPEQLLDLEEGTPELEVVRQGERYLLRVTPELRGELDATERYFLTNEERREAEALRLVTLVQDSPPAAAADPLHPSPAAGGPAPLRPVLRACRCPGRTSAGPARPERPFPGTGGSRPGGPGGGCGDPAAGGALPRGSGPEAAAGGRPPGTRGP